MFDNCLDEGPPGKFTEATVTGARLDIPDQHMAIQQLDWRYYKPEVLKIILQAPFHWKNIYLCSKDLPHVDVIVASDIIFAKELHDSLSSLLVDLLKVQTSTAKFL